ncbi:hypothetical protein Taro_039318 [Colocasia esculenta]|uniref:BED-type domain-containing protein n=1 Tax=Colocasia esculenta TaxID=4460 RepID=A0A843WR75_COLES|nr:hypothetical protein [Colocasia esculenta]
MKVTAGPRRDVLALGSGSDWWLQGKISWISRSKPNPKFIQASMSDTIDMDVEESVSLDTQVRDVSTSSSTKGRRLRYVVWNDFTRERKGDDSFVAICNHCQKVLSGGSQHGTTHLKKHLRICIPYQDARRGKSRDNEDFKFNQELSREKLAHMLVMHEYPFSLSIVVLWILLRVFSHNSRCLLEIHIKKIALNYMRKRRTRCASSSIK